MDAATLTPPLKSRLIRILALPGMPLEAFLRRDLLLDLLFYGLNLLLIVRACRSHDRALVLEAP